MGYFHRQLAACLRMGDVDSGGISAIGAQRLAWAKFRLASPTLRCAWSIRAWARFDLPVARAPRPRRRVAPRRADPPPGGSSSVAPGVSNRFPKLGAAVDGGLPRLDLVLGSTGDCQVERRRAGRRALGGLVQVERPWRHADVGPGRPPGRRRPGPGAAQPRRSSELASACVTGLAVRAGQTINAVGGLRGPARLARPACDDRWDRRRP